MNWITETQNEWFAQPIAAGTIFKASFTGGSRCKLRIQPHIQSSLRGFPKAYCFQGFEKRWNKFIRRQARLVCPTRAE